ncbi:GrpB family protein [Natronoglomus mannanivorans]|uniref:GrpB family protein n=1 Tax=Natronoglomus mannanivorans TaxID=2979990 RepID=A0AAP3E4K9_9EURY|nr:GrpB family protein [Halobacteria archaeon AArc-xg1-1]
MHEHTIEIVDYDPAWPTLFERESERMRPVVGDRVISIEHVGSTSVPGLAAKPIVDICPVVEDMDAAWTVSDLLDEAEWPLARERGDKPWIEHQRIAESGQEYNIHIRPHEAAVENYLLLREYLRDHPKIRDEYARVKREAADEYPHDVESYTIEKNGIIEQAKEQAREAGYEDCIDL